MNNDRRAFLSASLAAAWAAGHSVKSAADEPIASEGAGPAQVEGLPCLDYGRSFICNAAPFNSVRFWIESRTILRDDQRQVEFYQCGSCKSENTFGEKDLFIKDNYDFLPILGDGHWLVFRRTAHLNPNYRQIKKTEEFWGPANVKARAARKVAVLDTWDKIREYAATDTPIVGRTELRDEQTGLSALLEYPVKTLNIGLDKQMYQVDTGPVAFPDLSHKFDPLIDCLRLAFVAFNAPHFADFVIEQPTPIDADTETPVQIHHFSGPISQPARNVLLAVEA